MSDYKAIIESKIVHRHKNAATSGAKAQNTSVTDMKDVSKMYATCTLVINRSCNTSSTWPSQRIWDDQFPRRRSSLCESRSHQVMMINDN